MSNRTARRVLRDRVRSNRATARIRRNGVASLATHCMAAGLRPTEARTVAATLRKHTTKLGLAPTVGFAYRDGEKRVCARWTAAQVARAAQGYRPRKAAYKAAQAHLVAASS